MMYGIFYNDDSFIILHIKKINYSLDYTSYILVGKQSTKDETGAAIYKIFELDEFFRGGIYLFIKLKRKTSRAQEIPLFLYNLIQEDLFILDTGLELFTWRREKTKPEMRFSTCLTC